MTYHTNISLKEASYQYPCKGVTIRNNKGSIALRYTYQGKQVDCFLGLIWDSVPNHHKAREIAQVLYNDLFIFDIYDVTKAKYQLKKKQATSVGQTQTKPKEPTLKEIWEFYKSQKKNIVKHSTQKDWKYVDAIFSDFSNTLVLPSEVAKIVIYLKNKYALGTIEGLLVDLRSAINLAITYGIYNGKNLLPQIIESLNITGGKKTIRIFTKEELKAVLDAFENNTYCSSKSTPKHSYYYAFVKIRALTGMRPSETIALTWEDIIEKNGKLWLRINKRYVDGGLIYGTKNGVDIRMFPINSELKVLLENIPKNSDTRLIFTGWRNKSYLNCDNFVKRAWKKNIKGLINDSLISDPLDFYDLRHTFISHMARSGKVDLKTLANICGNSVDTIIKYYLAVDESLELPSLIDDD